MTAYVAITGGSRRRAVVDQATYEATPPQARDQDLPSTVHYVVDPTTDDAFLQGVYWGLSFALSTIFGDTLGALLEQATLSSVEEWNGTTWVPLA